MSSVNGKAEKSLGAGARWLIGLAVVVGAVLLATLLVLTGQGDREQTAGDDDAATAPSASAAAESGGDASEGAGSEGAASADADGAEAEDGAAAPSSSAGSEASPSVNETYEDSPVVRREADDPMAVGDLDAPIVLSQWTDLNCPHCATFAEETLPTLVKEYADEGKVRIEVNDVALLGPTSEDAAVAARAAAEQDLYFEYTHAIYAANTQGGGPELTRERLVEVAEEVGVPDMDRFQEDLDSQELRRQVQDSTEQARRVGVQGVPFFAIGDIALSGAQPVEAFRGFIDDQLDKVGQGA